MAPSSVSVVVSKMNTSRSGMLLAVTMFFVTPGRFGFVAKARRSVSVSVQAGGESARHAESWVLLPDSKAAT